jgi:hypothetical protein
MLAHECTYVMSENFVNGELSKILPMLLPPVRKNLRKKLINPSPLEGKKVYLRKADKSVLP